MKTFLLGLLLAAGCGVWAQKSVPVFNFRTAISANPSVLLGPDHTLMVGGEHRLQNKLALTLDAGYVFSSSYLGREVVKGAGGFSVRPGIKLYSKLQKRSYVAFQVFYKQVDYKLYDWLGKDCVNDVAAYEQLQNFTFRKKSVSYNLLFGQLFRLTDGVLLELYGGLGVKTKRQHSMETNSCYDLEGGAFFNTIYRDHFVGLNIPFGLKVVVPVQ